MIARHFTTASTAVALFGIMVGCSKSEGTKEYDVPHSLCGVSLDRALVSELLPPGKNIEVQQNNPVPSRHRCQVNIDGEAALMLSQEWWRQGNTVADVARGIPQLENAKLTDDDGDLHTGTGAVKETRCVSQDHRGQNLFAAVQVFMDGVDGAEAVRKLVKEYSLAVEKSKMCR
ncbi:hypothetical protein [Streptomyces sp. NPDC052701]|uniref:hypothetical protein n=1 Tax=Streptomyces sp. NPDC052701 TaxID=3155533 RepID=UPI00343E8F76